jgi:cytochrome c oxidase assembly factor CtaG
VSTPDVGWQLNPTVLLPLVLYSAVYLWRFRTARREAGGRGARAVQALAFAAAVLILFVAVASPIDALGERYLFSAHMVQHILLGDIAPLLVLLALSRVILRPATRRLVRIERALGRLAHPATGLCIWLVLIYVWHIPALYDAALRNPFLHALEHVSFFTAGLALWWPLIQPVPMRHRLSGLGGLAYIGVAKAGLAGLGLYLVWSTSVAFSFYESVPRIWGLSAIEDQNVGGAIMMVEQSLVLVVTFFVLFVRMLVQSEQDELRRERLEDAAAV